MKDLVRVPEGSPGGNPRCTAHVSVYKAIAQLKLQAEVACRVLLTMAVVQQQRHGLRGRVEQEVARIAGLNFLPGLVYVLLLLAIVIALLGIANTLSLAVYERRREIGLLRAVGETRRQVRSILRLESVIVSSFGTLVGVVVGAFIGWSLFEAIAQRNATFSVSVVQLILVVVIRAFAGVLAGWRPARRASRVAILDAIAVQ